ncbi:CDP-glycerol glycerophosphotransferase family protein [Lederbergia panacisoli]|uniref:CDP-glycerol glycerophosphotransferase family protein n=1 Tax=Lederbergia panacisoli TaxID=1255251 RepID=UPI00214B0DC0|nr:CDP-glycerol glycerophosphotransferase family protein [Lederbergia panacisoli]MCR2821423.1 CDP-glycerol glycerophosphotransferase family protein [Lederbergia panacisoli]
MNIKLLPTIIVKYLIRSAFFLFSLLFPVNEKKITFASYRSVKLEGNLQFIYQEMANEYKDITLSILMKKFNGSFFGKLDYVWHMLKACYALATSKFFIIDDFYFPVYVIKPRKGTEIIQLWHAPGAFKKFGLSTIGKSFGTSKEYLKHVPIHSNYSRVYVSSQKVVPYYADAFGLPEESIFPLGVPRTDFFFDHDKMNDSVNKFYLRFPELINKKLILYAPTYRGDSHNQDHFNCPIDIPLLREIVGDEYALIINLHPYMKKSININKKDENFAFLMNGEFSIEDLLAATDILITDYSSVIFDYSILEKPMAFYATELEDYKEERDFYFDYESFIPGPLFTETQSLGKWIYEGVFNKAEISKFKNEFFDFIDGNASKRIVDHLQGKEVAEQKKELLSNV